jgi:hypothetical protein
LAREKNEATPTKAIPAHNGKLRDEFLNQEIFYSLVLPAAIFPDCRGMMPFRGLASQFEEFGLGSRRAELRNRLAFVPEGMR